MEVEPNDAGRQSRTQEYNYRKKLIYKTQKADKEETLAYNIQEKFSR